MTQKEIEKFLANTKVYVNGKSKEIQEKLFSLGYCWIDSKIKMCNTKKPFLYLSERKEIAHGNDMEWFTEHKYREISAEQILSLKLTEPVYRPFKDVEECWNEMLKHEPFGWLKPKDSNSFVCIGDITRFSKNVHITWSTNEQEYFTPDSIFENYTFADGAPFGIKEDID